MVADGWAAAALRRLGDILLRSAWPGLRSLGRLRTRLLTSIADLPFEPRETGGQPIRMAHERRACAQVPSAADPLVAASAWSSTTERPVPAWAAGRTASKGFSGRRSPGRHIQTNSAVSCELVPGQKSLAACRPEGMPRDPISSHQRRGHLGPGGLSAPAVEGTRWAARRGTRRPAGRRRRRMTVDAQQALRVSWPAQMTNSTNASADDERHARMRAGALLNSTGASTDLADLTEERIRRASTSDVAVMSSPAPGGEARRCAHRSLRVRTEGPAAE